MGAVHTAAVFSNASEYSAAAIPLRMRLIENIPMGFPDNLRAIRKQRGLTQRRLAELLDVEQPTIGRYEGGRAPTLTQAQEIADVLGVSLAELVSDGEALAAGPRLRLKGEVAGGVWKDAVEWPQNEWLEYTGRSDVAADARHRFGLRVVGESMNEIYPHGTILDCVSIFGQAEIVPGKRVIVVRKRIDGEFEATVKEYHVDAEGVAWLRPRSSHPDFQRWMRIDEDDPEIEETVVTAIVVAAIRPE